MPMFDTDFEIYFNDSDFDESYDQWLDEESYDLEEEESDEDYLNYAEDALMEAHLFGDC